MKKITVILGLLLLHQMSFSQRLDDDLYEQCKTDLKKLLFNNSITKKDIGKRFVISPNLIYPKEYSFIYPEKVKDYDENTINNQLNKIVYFEPKDPNAKKIKYIERYFYMEKREPFVYKVEGSQPIDLKQIRKVDNPYTRYTNFTLNLPIGLMPLNSVDNLTNQFFELIDIIQVDDNPYSKTYKFYYITLKNTSTTEIFVFMLEDKIALKVILNQEKVANHEHELTSFKAKPNIIRNTIGRYFENPKIERIQETDKYLKIYYSYNNANDSIIAEINLENMTSNIYDYECYAFKKKDFENLRLPQDYFKDEALKRELLTSIKESSYWMMFEINKIILTSKSEWIYIKNSLNIVTGRTMFTDVYVKHKLTGNCYLAKEVRFEQSSDLVNGFIYKIVTQTRPDFEMYQYPCNLKIE